MATHGGHRNIAMQKALFNVSWLVGGGAAVPSAVPEQLLIRSDKADGSAADIYLAAIGFNPTLPGWTAEGSSGPYTDCTLALYVTHPTYPATLLCKYAATPLTAGMTCSALDTAWAAGTQTPAATTLTIDNGGRWYLYTVAYPEGLQNGLMFGLSTSAAGSYIYDAALGSIVSGQPAVLMVHYNFSARDEIVAGDAIRPDLTALMDYLTGLAPADVRIVECSIQHSEMDSAIADVDASELVRAGGDITLRASVPPLESWTTGTSPFGTLSIARPSDVGSSNILTVEQYRRINGTPVRLQMDIVKADNGTSLAEMAAVQAVASHAEQTTAGLDIELISPAAQDLDGIPARFWPETITPTPADGLEYENESAANVLFDLLLNVCPSTRWSNILAGDWFWLYTRFGGTWGAITITETQMAAVSSIRAVFDEMAATLCLCVGTNLAGDVQVWHPAVYRPSMRVWTLDPLEEYAAGLKLTGLEAEQYDSITIPYQVGGTDYTETLSGDGNVRLSARGRTYTHAANVDYCDYSGMAWLRFSPTRNAIYRQLAQRLIYSAVKLTFSIGLRGLTWQLGDQLMISSDILGLTDTTFMVTSLAAAPMASTVEVEAVHYTGWPGGHSLFQGTPPLGLYRWRRRQAWVTAVGAFENPTLDNLSWGTDIITSLAINGPGSTWGTRTYGSWEGAAMYIEETGAVDAKGRQAVAVTYARTQLPLQSGTHPNQIDVQVVLDTDALAFVGNKEYDWIWRWWDHGTGEGIALLARNPYAPNPCPVSNMLFVLAHCTNCNPGIGLWGGANIIASVSTPYGEALPAAAGAGTPGLIKSFSIAWDAENTARLYDGQRLIGTLTSTPVPTAMDGFGLRTPSVGSGQYLMNSLLRLCNFEATPGAELMLPDDGIDPYYP